MVSFQHEMPEERVHITYDLDPKSEKKKELPFVVGVLGDFSGNKPSEKPKKLLERKFVQIDRYNFDEVLDRMKPGVQFRVTNTLEGSGEKELPVSLKFSSMDDFEPAAVAQQVTPLRKLLETREKISDALSKSSISPEFEDKVAEILRDPAEVEKLAKELGIESAPSGEGSSPSASDGEAEESAPDEDDDKETE